MKPHWIAWRETEAVRTIEINLAKSPKRGAKSDVDLDLEGDDGEIVAA